MGKIIVIGGVDYSSTSFDKVYPVLDKVNITVICSPSNGGTVTGTGSYMEGDNVPISAIADEGYKFVQWSDGHTNATRTITVGASDETYTAIFEYVGVNISFDFIGYINTNGTFVDRTPYGDWMSTDFIETDKEVSYKLRVVSALGPLVSFYDETKKFLKDLSITVTGEDWFEGKFSIPDGAKYFRLYTRAESPWAEQSYAKY